MATKSFFTIRLGDENISTQGWNLSPRFACRIDKGHGYRITHLPSGFLLTDMGFATVEGAKSLADAIEAIVGKHLDQSNVDDFQDFVRTDPACKSLYNTIKKMNHLAKTKLIMDDVELSAWIEGMKNGQ